jgi:pimeloyl-ACP methyl ester carboxylesterase
MEEDMTTSTPPSAADRAWTEEIVYTETEDGLQLAGIAIRPAATSARLTARAVIVWIHGNASNFYAPAYVAIGRELATRGHPVISANTRGHDISAIIGGAAGPMAGTGGGAGWERFEETPRDLAAWVGRAASLAGETGEETGGGAGVIVAGHSSGAQRVALYAAERPDPRVRGLVLASPDLRGFFPPGEIDAARTLVAAGKDLEVLPAQPYVPWYRQCARTVSSRADVTARRFADDAPEPALLAIAVPILAFYGTREHNAATHLEGIRARAAAAPRVDTPLISDADHFYTGHEPEIAETIATWAAALTTA